MIRQYDNVLPMAVVHADVGRELKIVLDESELCIAATFA
jgi:hypothetical protein